MNFIKRITSADAPTAATATFAIAAVAIIVLGVTETMAAAAGARSAALLQAAETQARGPERDSLLAAAHEAAVDGIGLAPRDAGLEARQARILYLQATTATVAEISIPLLDAASAAAQRALKHSPQDAGARAILALAAAAKGGAPTPAVAEDVQRSYAGRAREPDVALWRGEAAAAAWPVLQGETRVAAATELCALDRAGLVQARARTVLAGIGATMGLIPDSAGVAPSVCALPNAQIAAPPPPPVAETEPESKPEAPAKKERRRKRDSRE